MASGYGEIRLHDSITRPSSIRARRAHSGPPAPYEARQLSTGRSVPPSRRRRWAAADARPMRRDLDSLAAIAVQLRSTVSISASVTRMLNAPERGPSGANSHRNSGASRHTGADWSDAMWRRPRRARPRPSVCDAPSYTCPAAGRPLWRTSSANRVLAPRTLRASTCALWTVSIHARTNQDSTHPEMLYIHPDECIDCGACVPACPGRSHLYTG